MVALWAVKCFNIFNIFLRNSEYLVPKESSYPELSGGYYGQETDCLAVEGWMGPVSVFKNVWIIVIKEPGCFLMTRCTLVSHLGGDRCPHCWPLLGSIISSHIYNPALLSGNLLIHGGEIWLSVRSHYILHFLVEQRKVVLVTNKEIIDGHWEISVW